MAVSNSLQAKQKNPMVITFAAGDEQVKLSPQIVRNYLVNGSAETVTDQEIVMFMNLCKFQHLNPFLLEAYLIKYGSQPATIVTGKAALEKRAARCKNFEGFAAGVIVIDHNGELKYRDGCLVLNGEELVGGWCDVHVTGFKVPVRTEVSLNEYIGHKKDGTVNAQWAGKPATMIRKVAKMQALREAFPEDFQGMYSAEEVAAGDYEMPNSPIAQPTEAPQAQPEQPHIVDVEPMPDNVPPDNDFAALLEG
jgi:phage recombination protein Bet